MEKSNMMNDENLYIEELNFSVATYNGLKRAGIDKLNQLVELTKEDLRNMKHIREKHIDQITEILAKMDLQLKE